MPSTYSYLKRRKLVYIVAIFVLLGITYAHKSIIIDNAAQHYDITETNLGKIDLGGSISRFVLSSFRGPLVCGLWWEVDKLQQKHDYKQLEFLLTALTKLQPHYKGPWKYQGWNLAYNVSVEFDRVEDKYYYISKGIRWLANGEEINRIKLYDPNSVDNVRIIGDPEMRSEIAQYLSGKMYYADEQLLLKPLMQLSCIPVTQRNATLLSNDAAQFARFKTQYPRLIRRIAKYASVPDGDEFSINRETIKFLTEYKDIPSLWSIEPNGSAMISYDPWPRWPNMENKELIGKVADNELLQDALDVARHWYIYSTEMLPTPKVDMYEDVTPEQDKFTRLNRTMHSIVFRAKPAQTQSRSAQELYKEGWGMPAQKEAEKAFAMWSDLGNACNLEHASAVVEKNLDKARQYAVKYKERAEMMLPPPDYLKTQNPEEYKRANDDYRSYMFTSNLTKLRNLCRYEYWISGSDIARTDTYRDAQGSRYYAEQRYTDWPISKQHYDRCVALLQLCLRQNMSPVEVMSFRTSLLMPGLASLAAQLVPTVSSRLTYYGNNETTHEELLDIQERYLKTVARCIAPNRLRAEYVAWDIKQTFNCSMVKFNPCAFMLPVYSLIPKTAVLDIDFIEDIIEASNGPLDQIIPSNVKANKERDKMSSRK